MGVRYWQHKVMQNTDFLGAVEASMMLVASEVIGEDPETTGHVNRLATATALFIGNAGDLDRFTRLFAWRAVFTPVIQGQVFNPATQAITPQNIDDTDLDTVVRSFWNAASNVPE